jgi:hypothetical protein
MRRVLVAAALVALAGCADRQVEQAVRSTLKDPDSAQFSDIWRKDGTSCGTVNAKNAMGGYVGATPFLLRNGIAVYTGDGAYTCCQKIKDGADDVTVQQCIEALPMPAIVTD